MNEAHLQLILKYTNILLRDDKRSLSKTIEILEASVESDFPNAPTNCKKDFIQLFYESTLFLNMNIEKTIAYTKENCNEDINKHPVMKIPLSRYQKAKDLLANYKMFLVAYNIAVLAAMNKIEGENDA